MGMRSAVWAYVGTVIAIDQAVACVAAVDTDTAQVAAGIARSLEVASACFCIRLEADVGAGVQRSLL